MAVTDSFTLTLSCPDRSGIVHAVSSHVAIRGGDIVEHQQFDDAAYGWLFLRTQIAMPAGGDLASLSEGFDDVAAAFDMDYTFHPARRVRVLVMVSTLGQHRTARPGDQHPPLVPARVQGREALPPGLRPRRQARGGDGALRDP